jgi:hypothetical protein
MREAAKEHTDHECSRENGDSTISMISTPLADPSSGPAASRKLPLFGYESAESRAMCSSLMAV